MGVLDADEIVQHVANDSRNDTAWTGQSKSTESANYSYGELSDV